MRGRMIVLRTVAVNPGGRRLPAACQRNVTGADYPAGHRAWALIRQSSE
jgi:hypothetical protein